MLKRVFLWGALLLLLVPLLAACAGSPPAPTASEPTAAGTSDGPTSEAAPTTAEQPATAASDVTVSMPFNQGGITSFDHAYWTAQLLISQGTIFEGLYGYDQQLNIVPKVAESATPSENNTVWTIKLRQDKKWSNGDPVTANDFAASWLRFMGADLADAPMWAGFQQYVVNGWAFKSGAVAPEEVGIKVIDDYTLEITLTQPNPTLVNLLVLSSSMPINAASLAEHPTDWWDPAHAVFNGPYVVQSWVSGGDTTLTRNPNYVGEGIGNVGTIILKPFADPNARLQAFENGEIHYTALEDASQVQYARNNAQFSENIKEELSLNWEGIQFDKAAIDGPWADIRVRKAFAMSIDKQVIADQVLRGLASPTTTFSGDPEIIAGVTPLPYDVEQAKALLAEAGYPNGQGFPNVMFYAPPANFPDMPVIEAIAKMWQDNLGVTVTIQNNEGPVYSTLQWGRINTGVEAGYTMLSGPLNWFEPGALLEASDQIWYTMDFASEWKPKSTEFDRLINEAPNITEAGDWDELQARAEAAWATRQEIMEIEKDNDWGEVMRTPPSFIENFNEVAERFNAATDDAEKLAAYRDGLLAVLREELDTQQYANLGESNLQAQRLLAKLRKSTMEEAIPIVIELQQLAVDSAWMTPAYVRKLIYVTDPRLSGIVLNKLAWGGNFQYQYLQWTE